MKKAGLFVNRPAFFISVSYSNSIVWVYGNDIWASHRENLPSGPFVRVTLALDKRECFR